MLIDMLFRMSGVLRDILICFIWRSLQYTGQNTLIGRRQSPRQFIPIEEPVCQQHATWSSGTGALMRPKGGDGVGEKRSRQFLNHIWMGWCHAGCNNGKSGKWVDRHREWSNHLPRFSRNLWWSRVLQFRDEK